MARTNSPQRTSSAPPAPPEEDVKPSLSITKLDEKFAPGKENLDVCYTLTGLKAKPVTITVTGSNHPNGPVFEKELEAGEKSDGTHVFHWDGKSTATAGPLKGLSANPLHSPYKVKIAGGGQDSGEKDFKILYHSIALKQGPWTPNEKEPPEAEEKAWV
ncbi:MAG: hypothetical protein M3Y08_07265 [Fibrobacterota bacterium]|nr:hypothetical protein [Fibrobacterota bacterium]